MERYSLFLIQLIPRPTIDISALIGSDDLKKTEIITFTSVDKMKIEDINNQIIKGVEKLTSNTHQNYNRKHLMARILPSL